MSQYSTPERLAAIRRADQLAWADKSPNEPQEFDSIGFAIYLATAALERMQHARGFSRLTTKQREQVVRKLATLSRYAEAAKSANRQYEHVYVEPVRLELAIARLTQFVAMLPYQLCEVPNLERRLAWLLIHQQGEK